MTGPNVLHAVPAGNAISFFLLIDPTSHLAELLQNRYLQGSSCFSIQLPEYPPADRLNSVPDDQIIQIVEDFLAQLGLFSEPDSMLDGRIQQLIENIISGQWLACSVREIAASMYLSESRLTHLFKESAGISLKSYLVIQRLERAYRCITSGEKLTRSAHESGFASSAHLAYTCKKLTGISVSDVLKKRKTAEF
ncbi:MAG: helix-turn-helix transcriptional regulator [Clostridia bacterium]|nr:helix-turn-helix transcriptional regulator [Clostridia bacterium]